MVELRLQLGKLGLGGDHVTADFVNILFGYDACSGKSVEPGQFTLDPYHGDLLPLDGVVQRQHLLHHLRAGPLQFRRRRAQLRLGDLDVGVIVGGLAQQVFELRLCFLRRPAASRGLGEDRADAQNQRGEQSAAPLPRANDLF